MEEARFDGKGHLVGLVNEQFGTKLKWPKNLRLPPEYDNQLERAGRIAFKGGVVKGKLIDPDTYKAMNVRVQRRVDWEKARLQKLGTDFHGIFNRQTQHVGDVSKRLGHRLDQSYSTLGKFDDDLMSVFRGEHGNLLDNGKALIDTFKEQANNIVALRRDLQATLDRELQYYKQFKREWEGYYNDIEKYVDSFKKIIDNPKDAVLDLLIDQELKDDITGLADELGYGDELGDFFGDGSGGGSNDVPGGGSHDLPGGGSHDVPTHDAPSHDVPDYKRRRVEASKHPGKIGPGMQNANKHLGKPTLQAGSGKFGAGRPHASKLAGTKQGRIAGSSVNRDSAWRGRAARTPGPATARPARGWSLGAADSALLTLQTRWPRTDRRCCSPRATDSCW